MVGATHPSTDDTLEGKNPVSDEASVSVDGSPLRARFHFEGPHPQTQPPAYIPIVGMVAAILGIGLYSVLVGASFSVLRVAIMGVCLLFWGLTQELYSCIVSKEYSFQAGMGLREP